MKTFQRKMKRGIVRTVKEKLYCFTVSLLDKSYNPTRPFLNTTQQVVDQVGGGGVTSEGATCVS